MHLSATVYVLAESQDFSTKMRLMLVHNFNRTESWTWYGQVLCTIRKEGPQIPMVNNQPHVVENVKRRRDVFLEEKKHNNWDSKNVPPLTEYCWIVYIKNSVTIRLSSFSRKIRCTIWTIRPPPSRQYRSKARSDRQILSKKADPDPNASSSPNRPTRPPQGCGGVLTTPRRVYVRYAELYSFPCRYWVRLRVWL